MKIRTSIFLCLLVFSSTISHSQSKVERMDPPGWWIGMKWNTVQVMLYGENLAGLKPSIDYPGVNLKRSSNLSNPNYLFLDIEIEASAKPGALKILLDGKEEATFPLNSREENRKSLWGFGNSDAIYLITPDRFANGKPENDSLEEMKEKMNRQDKNGRHGGDIAGIKQNLDYIKGLGFTAIWLNPVLENNMTRVSYHGYSTTDFYKVDPRYGSNEEYRELAEEARSKGMKLIMDMIVNHIGSEHWWMEDLPSSDWINQWEKYTGTNHRRTTLQDPYASDKDKKLFTDGWFVPTMPDLNQRNEYLGDYLIQNSIWWTEYLGLAGIRMDTYPYPDMDYMSKWTRALMEEYTAFNIVGEEWSPFTGQVSYWQRGKENRNGYTSELPSLMDFPIQMAMVNALNSPEEFGKGWPVLYETLAQDYLYPDPENLVIFPDNHDMSRIFTQVNENYDLFKLAIAYVATMRGIPQIYYGTEILMSDKTGEHGVIRSDFPGGWKGDKVNAISGKGLTTQQKDAMVFISKLLNWRKSNTAVQYGKLTHFIPENGVYTYFRYDSNGKVMVILSKNSSSVKLNMSRFSEMIHGESSARNIITGESFTLGSSIDVPANSALILELK